MHRVHATVSAQSAWTKRLRDEALGYVVLDELDIAIARHPQLPDGLRLSLVVQGSVYEVDLTLADAARLTETMGSALQSVARSLATPDR
jgi:hypothetical protein